MIYQGLNVFMSNLDGAVNDKQLQLFSKRGQVKVAKVTVSHYSGLDKDYVFVGFSFPKEAINVVIALNGTFYHGKVLFRGFSSV